MKRKPIGNDYKNFLDEWETGDHTEKLELAKAYGVTYDTMRHWASDGPSDPVPKVGKPPEVETAPEEWIDELLVIPYTTALDCVPFDLETSNQKADFSIILTAVIKAWGKKPVTFRADNYSTFKTDRADDLNITCDITRELSKHAFVITHYGSKFDLPYLRAKMVKHGLPALPPMFAIDTYKIAHANFAVSSRRLKSLGAYFGIGAKTGVEGTLWNEAAYSGSKKAIDQILAHNIQDCILLEKLASLSFPYLKAIPKA